MKSSHRRINIAIDGPAGAGKSTIARFVANELNYIYVDTGAMYRAVAWKSLQEGILITETNNIIHTAERLDIRLIPKANGQQVIVDEIDVTEHIRSQEVNRVVSHIAQIAQVRAILVNKQQKLAAAKGVVMDGRDIATHVLPNAEVKIYLTASVEERAKRRLKEMSGSELTLNELMQEISLRDTADMQREVSPLIVTDQAIVIDCTKMTISEVVEQILAISRTKMGGE